MNYLLKSKVMVLTHSKCKSFLSSLQGKTHEQRLLSSQSAAVLFFKVLGVLIAFVIQIPLTHMLGAPKYGAYVYLLAWASVISIFCRFGWDTVIVRFLPIYLSNQEWAKSKGIIILSFTFPLLLWLIIAAIIFSFPFPNKAILVAFILVMVLIPLLQGGLRATKRFYLAETLDLNIRPILLISFFLLSYYFFSNTSVEAALLSHLYAAAIVLLILSFWFLNHLPSHAIKTSPSWEDRYTWLGLAVPMLLITGTRVLINRTDIIMLGLLSSETSVGVYAICVRLSEFVGFGLLSANSIIGPYISELYASGRLDRLKNLLKTQAFMVTGFTVVAGAGLALAGPYLLMLFGVEFVSGYVPMLILIGGQIINALTGATGLILVMTGRQTILVWTLFASLIINIFLNLVLIPLYGPTGAAAASFASVAFWNGILFIYIIKKLGLNPSIFSRVS